MEKGFLLSAFCLLLLCGGINPPLLAQVTAGPAAGGAPTYGQIESGFAIPSLSCPATGLSCPYTTGNVYQAGNNNAINAGLHVRVIAGRVLFRVKYGFQFFLKLVLKARSMKEQVTREHSGDRSRRIRRKYLH